MEKTYTCERWPFFRLGSLQFRDGTYTTSDEAEQARLEKCDAFGAHVKLVEDEVSRLRGPDGRFMLEEEAEEEEAPRRAPGRSPSSSGGARQGTTGTGDLRSRGE